MKLKKEYLLLLVVIAALCAYLVTRSKDQTHFELPQIVEVESSKINRLVISKGESTIELNKKDDKWYIGPKDFLADSVHAKNMVNAASDLNITALVSESGNYERYDLSKDKKVSVKAFADKKVLRDFDIGRQASTRQHTFITLANNPKVYHARGTIDATFGKTTDELRDKIVLSYVKDNATALTISKGSQTMTFAKKEAPKEDPATEKKEGPQEPQAKKDPSAEKKEAESQATIQWQDAQGNIIAKADVDRIVGDFSKLKCDAFLEDNAGDKLKDPIWSVTVISDKKNHKLSIFKKDGKEGAEYSATSSDSPHAFVIHKSRVETFGKQIEKLLNPKKADK